METNYGTIIGTVLSDPIVKENKFHSFTTFEIGAKRTSGNVDKITVNLDDGISSEFIKTGTRVEITGMFCSRNSYKNDKRKCFLFFKAQTLSIVDDSVEDLNEISLYGTICKKGELRITPISGDTIIEFTLAINRGRYSDYINCIAWGHNAEMINLVEIGEEIGVDGRIQSRCYVRKDCDTEYRTNEVSARNLMIGENEE